MGEGERQKDQQTPGTHHFTPALHGFNTLQEPRKCHLQLVGLEEKAVLDAGKVATALLQGSQPLIHSHTVLLHSSQALLHSSQRWDIVAHCCCWVWVGAGVGGGDWGEAGKWE